jgi:hypothetical protein
VLFGGTDSAPRRLLHEPAGLSPRERSTPNDIQPVDHLFGVEIAPTQGDSQDDGSHSTLFTGGRRYIRTRLGARTPLTEEQRNDPHYTRLFGNQGGWTEVQRPAST